MDPAGTVQENPKIESSVRKLGIPTVMDRVIQQAIRQIMGYAEQDDGLF
ncbi:MAG: hypothetical protein LKI76_09560 [Megasphaera sp.]|jgi:retron-type reverse transcriptase|nr:hypothetical protein [Megasphaera sp.]MCI1824163.1 hypothetical protein [Megasphaera sp.]